ncbi:Actin related protein [Giardia muris]|uniref:Actin related protein n=1 Tax=Giardia muris TaxID=5742 RepID=A0A4Z1SUC4_GIAMU|nr:Actin related protein [Giardia muris]|eukprot:TNJ29502.1 Actin related protein [Giardia muris]
MHLPSLMTAPTTSVAVVDVGSYETRAGLSGLDGPTCVIPSFIVRDRQRGYLIPEYYLGAPTPEREVQAIAEGGRIVNTDRFDAFMRHLYNAELNGVHPTAIFLPHYTSRNERDILASTLFEKENIPALYLGDQEAAAAYSFGRVMSLVVDLGYGKSTISPIVDGQCLRKGSRTCSVTGSLLLDILEKEICHKLKQISSNQEMNVATASGAMGPIIVQGSNVQLLTNLQIKQFYNKEQGTYERHLVDMPYHSYLAYHRQRLLTDIAQFCLQVSHRAMDTRLDYRSMNDASRMDIGSTTQYFLPDGNHVGMGFMSTLIPETFFNTQLLHDTFGVTVLDTTSLQMHIQQAILALPDSVQGELAGNLVVTGGVSSVGGLHSRLKAELDAALPSILKVRLHTSTATQASRRFAVWQGGNVLCSLSTFPYFWVSRSEYDEFGVGILERRRL